MILLIEIVIIFIEQLLMLMLLELFCAPKQYSKKRLLFVAIILTTCSQVLNEVFAKNLIVNAIPFLVVGSYALLFLKGSTIRKLAITLLVIVNVLVVNILFLLLGSIFNASAYQLIYNGGLLFGYMLAISSKTCLYLEYSYIKNYFSDENELTTPTWRFIIGILALSLVCIGLTLNEFVNYDARPFYTGVIVITFILVNLLIFRLCVMVSKHANENANQKLLLESIRYETKLLDILQEKTEEVNRVNHDFKHHIATVNQLISDGKQETAKNYIQDIEIPENMDYLHTNNMVLNYILNEKIGYAKRIGIDVRFSVLCDENVNYIDNIDISIILGNLLDNAIEACIGVKEPDIEISITMDICSSVFEVRNTSKEVVIDGDRIITTKSDKKNHGFGMINIKKAVEKYKGDDYYEYDNGMFSHICILNNYKEQ